MDMNQEMLTEIQKQHQECKRLVSEAKASLRRATAQSLIVASLVEKSQRHHKSDIHGFLSPIMNGIESRGYMTVHKASQCRDIGTDKRVLQVLGVMDKAPPRKRSTSIKSPPSLTTKIAKANADISKVMKSRSVEQLTAQEALMAKEAMKPLATLFVKLSNRSQ
jgi:hypothetical protein